MNEQTKQAILELFVDCVKTALATGQGHLVNAKKFEEGLDQIPTAQVGERGCFDVIMTRYFEVYPDKFGEGWSEHLAKWYEENHVPAEPAPQEHAVLLCTKKGCAICQEWHDKHSPAPQDDYNRELSDGMYAEMAEAEARNEQKDESLCPYCKMPLPPFETYEHIAIRKIDEFGLKNEHTADEMVTMNRIIYWLKEQEKNEYKSNSQQE